MERGKGLMRNKYVISRRENVKYVRDNLNRLVNSALLLARYSEDDPLRQTASDNFYKAFEFIVSSPEVENDYQCLLKLHEILMEGLNEGIKSSLDDDQVAELTDMINQPAKANVEIAIDVMLYILDRRLFDDGDVRSAIMFANKIMVDNGCGIITVASSRCQEFRELYKMYRQVKTEEFKDWIYRYCVKGPKVEY